jgi:hypothetical protein
MFNYNLNLPILELAPPIDTISDNKRKDSLFKNDFTILDKFYLEYINEKKE